MGKGKGKRRVHSTGDEPQAKHVRDESKQPSQSSDQISDKSVIDAVIDSVASQCVVVGTNEYTDDSSVESFQKTVHELSLIMEQQQRYITKLSAQLSFILSYLNIPDVEQINDVADWQQLKPVAVGIVAGTSCINASVTGAGEASSDVAMAAAASVSSMASQKTMTSTSAAAVGGRSVSAQCLAVPPTYAAVASRSTAPYLKTSIVQPNSQSNHEAVVAAVYLDQNQRDRRAANIVITGLPVCSDMPDKILVTQMISKELLLVPDIVHLKRLGRVVADGPNLQPLLVVLRTAAQASTIIQRAKMLRSSLHPVISDHVFINRHLTRAQSRAAFEQRCQKRAASLRRNQNKSGPTSAVDDLLMSQIPVLPSPVEPLPVEKRDITPPVLSGNSSSSLNVNAASFSHFYAQPTPLDDLINLCQ